MFESQNRPSNHNEPFTKRTFSRRKHGRRSRRSSLGLKPLSHFIGELVRPGSSPRPRSPIAYRRSRGAHLRLALSLSSWGTARGTGGRPGEGRAQPPKCRKAGCRRLEQGMSGPRTPAEGNFGGEGGMATTGASKVLLLVTWSGRARTARSGVRRVRSPCVVGGEQPSARTANGSKPWSRHYATRDPTVWGASRRG
ncbi:MAG: hypothetical protein RL272_1135 [Candidatus Parcubacteria bacterium]